MTVLSRPIRSRAPGLLFAALVVAAGYLAAPTPANAVPFDYALSGASATFGTNGTDTLSGTFTFDEVADALDAVDIVVTGPLDPATLTVPVAATPNSITMSNAALTITFDIHFLDDLTNDSVFPHQPQSTPLAVVFAPPNLTTISTAVTGSAIPTPEPTSLALLGGVLGLFLLGRGSWWLSA